MPDVGDSITPSVDVYDWDNTTAATLTILDPDKIATAGVNPVANLVTVDGIPSDGYPAPDPVQVQRWTVNPVLLNKSTDWVFIWTVTGNGGGVQSETVWVEALPEPGGVAWRPTRGGVADYVRHRTVPEAFESQGEPLGTFTESTTPPGDSVDRIITRAVGWVLTATGTLDPQVYDAANEVASLRAAGFVELAGRPTVDRDLANALFQQADTALKALAARNTTLTGEDPDDPDAVFEILPVYSFPAPASYGDLLL